jgi:hypothetical protein
MTNLNADYKGKDPRWQGKNEKTPVVDPTDDGMEPAGAKARDS